MNIACRDVYTHNASRGRHSCRCLAPTCNNNSYVLFEHLILPEDDSHSLPDEVIRILTKPEAVHCTVHSAYRLRRRSTMLNNRHWSGGNAWRGRYEESMQYYYSILRKRMRKRRSFIVVVDSLPLIYRIEAATVGDRAQFRYSLSLGSLKLYVVHMSYSRSCVQYCYS